MVRCEKLVRCYQMYKTGNKVSESLSIVGAGMVCMCCLIFILASGTHDAYGCKGGAYVC